MLCEDKIIALYCIVDDLLKGIGHQEDGRRKVSDSEVMTTALVSSLYFGGHQGQCPAVYEDDKARSRYA